ERWPAYCFSELCRFTFSNAIKLLFIVSYRKSDSCLSISTSNYTSKRRSLRRNLGASIKSHLLEANTFFYSHIDDC
ncbi:hypothetical protein L9F63_023706, partial [Diploptera punctata]